MGRPLRCPGCGYDTDSGVDFTASRRQTIEQTYIVAGTHYDGTVELAPVDFHVMVDRTAARTTISCGSCGYSWATRRPIAVRDPL
jgi:transcription elongation factor Elf1